MTIWGQQGHPESFLEAQSPLSSRQGDDQQCNVGVLNPWLGLQSLGLARGLIISHAISNLLLSLLAENSEGWGGVRVGKCGCICQCT